LTLLYTDKFSVKLQIYWQKEKKRPVVFTLFNGSSLNGNELALPHFLKQKTSKIKHKSFLLAEKLSTTPDPSLGGGKTLPRPSL
jgi:hypothetical protein